MSNWTFFNIYFSFKTAMFEPYNPFFNGFNQKNTCLIKTKYHFTCLLAQSIQLQMMDASDGVVWGDLQGLSQ